MVKATIVISEDVDTRFRNAISRAYCQKHGNRKKAAEEAIIDWCVKIESRLSEHSK